TLPGGRALFAGTVRCCLAVSPPGFGAREQGVAAPVAWLRPRPGLVRRRAGDPACRAGGAGAVAAAAAGTASGMGGCATGRTSAATGGHRGDGGPLDGIRPRVCDAWPDGRPGGGRTRGCVAAAGRQAEAGFRWLAAA